MPNGLSKADLYSNEIFKTEISAIRTPHHHGRMEPVLSLAALCIEKDCVHYYHVIMEKVMPANFNTILYVCFYIILIDTKCYL